MNEILDVQASDAKARLAELLNEVERGRTIRITRHGRPIARLVPEAEVRAAEAAQAIDEMRALTKQFGKAPLAEVLASRREGLKY